MRVTYLRGPPVPPTICHWFASLAICSPLALLPHLIIGHGQRWSRLHLDSSLVPYHPAAVGPFITAFTMDCPCCTMPLYLCSIGSPDQRFALFTCPCSQPWVPNACRELSYYTTVTLQGLLSCSALSTMAISHALILPGCSFHGRWLCPCYHSALPCPGCSG